MPTITRIPKKPKSNHHNDTDMRKLRQKAYQSSAWQKTRAEHIRKEPLCQDCLEKGKVNAERLSVHHLKSPFRGGVINWDLLLDPTNLRTLCPECHSAIHKKENPQYINVDEINKLLDELMGETD